MKKFFILFIAFIVLVFSSCEKEDIDLNYRATEVRYSGYQLEVLKNINRVRRENGVDTLIPERILTLTALSHAIEMDSTNNLNHYGFEERYVYSGAYRFGEIVAEGFMTPMSEISAFENSPSHFNCMVNPVYTHIGIYKYGRFLCVNLASYRKY